jgi:hypothetical protein
MTPPGPPVEPEPEPAPRTGGLSVDEWLAASRQRATAGPYAFPRPPERPLPPASRKMAGWSLALSLAICIPFACLVAIGLAVAVLVKSRDGRDHGRGMAIAALVISGVIVLANVVYVVVVLFIGVDGTDRDDEGRVTEAGLVTLDRLRPGDCFSDDVLAEADVDEEVEASTHVRVVPCEETHQFEVFHVLELPDGDYPGPQGVEARLVGCLDAYTDYVGRRWRPRSGLDVSYYYPTKTSWRFGDRRVVCSLYEVARSERTGSLRGSRR